MNDYSLFSVQTETILNHSHKPQQKTNLSESLYQTIGSEGMTKPYEMRGWVKHSNYGYSDLCRGNRGTLYMPILLQHVKSSLIIRNTAHNY